MIELVFDEAEISENLQGFDPKFAEADEIQSLLLEPLTQFLKTPVNRQFQMIF